MKNTLSLISKIHEKGNEFIVKQLKNNGISSLVPSHGDILVCLYQNGKMTMKDIADKIHRTRPTVTVLIDKLEKSGFVEREISKEDNRYTYIILTSKGKNFQPLFEQISNELNNMLHKNLSESEADILETLLKKVIE